MFFYLQNPHHAMVAHVELQIPGERFYRVEIEPMQQVTCPHDLSVEEWRMVEAQLLDLGARSVDSKEACFVQFGQGSAKPNKLKDQALSSLQAQAERHSKLVEDEKKKYPKKKNELADSEKEEQLEVTSEKL